MSGPRRINSLSVETPSGFRSFNLVEGDIVDSRDELLVASSHELGRARPIGMVISALHERGVDFSNYEPLMETPAGIGASRIILPRGVFPWQVLVVRLPGADPVHIETFGSGRDFEQGLWTLFGSLSALELRDETYRSMSIPLLGGNRGYPVEFVVARILHHAVRWLKASRSMETVNVWIYEGDDAHLDVWSAAMDSAVGRRSVGLDSGGVLRGLADAVLERLADATPVAPPSLETTLEDMAKELRSNELRPAYVADVGRKLCEGLTNDLSTRRKLEPERDFYSTIAALHRRGVLSAAEASPFHTVRTLGNASIHHDGGFTDADTAPLLTALARGLEIWLERATSSG